MFRKNVLNLFSSLNIEVHKSGASGHWNDSIFTVVSSILGSSVWTLLLVTILAPIIWRCLPEFCALLVNTINVEKVCSVKVLKCVCRTIYYNTPCILLVKYRNVTEIAL